MSEGSIFSSVVDEIDRGREGLNVGLPMGFDRLVKYLPNIQQGTYYLIGAGTKVGKTSFADDAFLYNPYDYLLSNPDSKITLDIDYFSYEIEKKNKITKGIARKLWWDYGIIVDANTILSRGRNYCEDEIYDLVLNTRGYFEQMEDVLTIHDMPDNPTGINKYIISKAEQYGTITKRNINKDPKGPAIMRFDNYVPNDPNRYWLVFIDHLGLMINERGFSTKQNIDKISQYAVQWRNNFNISPVFIQQLAFDNESDERHKAGRLKPTMRDFGDSKYTTRDANVVMTLMDPTKFNLENFEGYDISRIGNQFRNLEILANRDGEPNINIGLNFIGPVGTFRELPRAGEMSDTLYIKAKEMLNAKARIECLRKT